MSDDVDLAAFHHVERDSPSDLADVLERVLDTGIVIAGEIRIDLLDIELLTIKLRLIVTSVDKAEQIGLDWWRNDSWYTSAISGNREQIDGGDVADEELDAVGRRVRREAGDP